MQRFKITVKYELPGVITKETKDYTVWHKNARTASSIAKRRCAKEFGIPVKQTKSEKLKKFKWWQLW